MRVLRVFCRITRYPTNVWISLYVRVANGSVAGAAGSSRFFRPGTTCARYRITWAPVPRVSQAPRLASYPLNFPTVRNTTLNFCQLIRASTLSTEGSFDKHVKFSTRVTWKIFEGIQCQKRVVRNGVQCRAVRHTRRWRLRCPIKNVCTFLLYF